MARIPNLQRLLSDEEADYESDPSGATTDGIVWRPPNFEAGRYPGANGDPSLVGPDVDPTPPRPRITVGHATNDLAETTQGMRDRLQALVDPSSQEATADAGQVRPGSMKGFFQQAVTGTGAPTKVPPEVAAFVAKQTGNALPAPDTSALDAAKKQAGLNDIAASLTDQLEIANGAYNAGRSARLHENAQQPVTDEKAKQDALRAFVEKKLGLQRQADQDALTKKNTESEIALRDAQAQQVGKPKPLDPLEAAKTKAEIGKLNAEAAKLGRHGDGEGLGTLKKKLEVQRLQQEIGDHDKGSYLEGYQLDSNAQPSKTELSTIRGAQSTKETVKQTIGDIERLYKQYGAKTLPDDVKGQLDTLTRDLQLSLKNKEAYDLGVLTGPDMGLLEGVTGTVTGPKATLLDFVGGNNAMAHLSALRSQIDRRFDNKARSLGYHRAGGGSDVATGPTPTGRTKTDRSGVVWEEMSDGTARKREG